MDAVEELLRSRIEELAAKCRKASDDYYNGQPSVTDEVYDAWRDELSEIQADNPTLKEIGAPVPQDSEWVKVRHEHTMGSLGKVNTPDELTKWATDIQRQEDRFLVTEKLDGISISLRYEDGQLVQAVTRGDGTIGEDIVSNVRRMKNVPVTIAVKDPVTVRGEIVLLKADFEKHFADKANTRNAAAGTSKRTDGKGSEHLSVLVYQIVEGVDVATEEEQFHRLKALGFTTPQWMVVPSAAGVNRLWQEYEDSLRDNLPYEIDGLVVRLNDLPFQISLGDVHGRPNGATAFKFTAPSRETTLRQVVWQVGSIGRITPVAVFDPVTLVGAEVTRASLYNLAYIEQLGVDVGAKVLVVRANDVIPRVTQVTESTGTVAKVPATCPVCGSPLARDGEYVICPNVSTCPAQTAGRIKQWVSELNILEWGDTLIQKVVEEGLVTTVADLYRLKKEQLAALDRMADKSAENALKTLWAASPMPLENFLGGLSIPLCATSTIRLVVDAGYDTVEKLHAASQEDFLKIDGLGPKRASSLYETLRGPHKELIQDILSTGVQIRARAVGALTGKSVCFTGKSVRKRAELENLATQAGGTVKGSVGKGLSFLVLADPDSNSFKAVAARKNGTTCISEEAFVSMCGGRA